MLSKQYFPQLNQYRKHCSDEEASNKQQTFFSYRFLFVGDMTTCLALFLYCNDVETYFITLNDSIQLEMRAFQRSKKCARVETVNYVALL